MSTYRNLSVLFVVGLLLLVPFTAVAAAGTTFTIDRDHALTSQSAIQTYERSGSVSTNLSSPKMTVRVAEEASACGLDTGLFEDTRNDYLCLTYKQETDATVRIDIPDAYWTPYVREHKESIADEAPATFSVVGNTSATRVRVSFSGPTHAVYPIPEDVSAAYSLLERADNRSSEYLGIDLLGSNKATQWQYRNLSSQNLTIKIKSPAAPSKTVVQYDSTPSGADRDWLMVPEDPDDPAPMYRTTKPQSDQTVYLVVQANELSSNSTPSIRYRAEGGIRGRINAALREIRMIRERISELLGGFPDWLGGGG